MPAAAPLDHQQHARDFLAAFELDCRRQIARRGEMDSVALAKLLEDGLDDLAQREQLLLFLAGFLGKCVTGCVPDYRYFEPPL
jgi:hypothetical protein